MGLSFKDKYGRKALEELLKYDFLISDSILLDLCNQFNHFIQYISVEYIDRISLVKHSVDHYEWVLNLQ